MRSFFRASLLAASGLVTCLTYGQGTPPVVSLKVTSAKIVAGKPFDAVVTVTFSDGLHGYQNPQSDPSLIPVTVTAGDKSLSVLKVNYPKGTPETVAGESKPINVYEGTIKIPVSIKAPVKLGKLVVKLSLGYQECNAQSCFPPSSITVEASVTVVKTAAASKAATKTKANR